MAGSDQEKGQKPSEQRGGTTPDEKEAREKGEWGAAAAEGVVPAEHGGSDAPSEMLAEDPELDSSVLGRTTGSDEPATDEGIDPSAGDEADAVSHGGPDVPEDAEPDLKDVAAAAREDAKDPDS
jgi:hypothetical protein